MKPRHRLVMAALVLLTGCGSGMPATAPQSTTSVPFSDDGYAALESARARWSAVGLGSYHYVFEDDCGECGPLVSSPREIVVWGQQQYDPGHSSPSVEEMFDEIERALDAGQTVAASFDEEYGHPVEVAIGMETRPVDGGTHWIVHELAPGLPGEDVSLSVVAEAERLWVAARPLAYEYTLTVFCECPLAGSVIARVEGERVVGYDILYDGPSGASITPLAIDDMFRDLADLMASADGVEEGGIRFTGSARFHPEFGYPIWVGLDIDVVSDDPVLADLPERLVITMSDLQPIVPEVPDSLSAEKAALQAARTRWAAAGLVDYDYELAIHAMATADFTGPFLVEVRDGVVSSVTREGLPVQPGQVSVYTVVELFTLIEQYLTNGIESAVLYSEEWGYPVFVQLDLNSIAVDGGLVMSIGNFVGG